MKCPKCEVPTKPVEMKSITVDRCPRCGGMWFEQDELRLLKNKEHHGEYRWVDVDLWKDPEKLKVMKESYADCPKDRTPMATIRYGDSDVAVEACPKCFGIWLDVGEYDKIIGHLDRKVESETVADVLADVEDEFVELFTGREGLKSEIADLGKVLYMLQLRFAIEHPMLVKIKEAIRHLFPE